MSDLTFSEFRRKNTMRCRTSFHSIWEWSPSDWACAMAGECGEACNEVKKLRRKCSILSDGEWKPTEKLAFDQASEKIADELADLITYADLLAARLGIDLGEAVARKFNAISDRVGSEIKLAEARG